MRRLTLICVLLTIGCSPISLNLDHRVDFPEARPSEVAFFRVAKFEDNAQLPPGITVVVKPEVNGSRPYSFTMGPSVHDLGSVEWIGDAPAEDLVHDQIAQAVSRHGVNVVIFLGEGGFQGRMLHLNREERFETSGVASPLKSCSDIAFALHEEEVVAFNDWRSRSLPLTPGECACLEASRVDDAAWSGAAIREFGFSMTFLADSGKNWGLQPFVRLREPRFLSSASNPYCATESGTINMQPRLGKSTEHDGRMDFGRGRIRVSVYRKSLSAKELEAVRQQRAAMRITRIGNTEPASEPARKARACQQCLPLLHTCSRETTNEVQRGGVTLSWSGTASQFNCEPFKNCMTDHGFIGQTCSQD